MVNWDSYYEPPDYGEGEEEVTENVYCNNADCDDFEVDVEWSGIASWYGNNYSTYTVYIEYTCPKCGQTSSHDFEKSSEGEDPDAAYERMRDEEW